MPLGGMVYRRIRKLLAWLLAVGVLALIVVGVYYLLQQAGVLAA